MYNKILSFKIACICDTEITITVSNFDNIVDNGLTCPVCDYSLTFDAQEVISKLQTFNEASKELDELLEGYPQVTI